MERHSTPKLVRAVLEDELSCVFIIYPRGVPGARGARYRACFVKRCLARCRTAPGVSRGGGDPTLLPPQTPRLGPLAAQSAQSPPGKQIAFLRPIDFLIFWHFLVASIPFLVFSSMSQKTKMSKQLRAEISISCQTAVFPALTKRAPHRMPRTGKMTNYIIFFPLNRNNHIPIAWFLLANQNMLWEKGKKSHCILFCNFYYVSCICWEGKKRRKFLQETLTTYFRLQHVRSKACLPDYFPLRTASIVQVPH